MGNEIEAFHKRYYDSGVWFERTKWMGVSVQKCPLDLWVYQELIREVKPDLIIETGTAFGGSALFLAHMCELLGRGHVVTIDIGSLAERPQHDRIVYLRGSSISSAILNTVSCMVSKAGRAMVILDSDHSMDYVLKEMDAYKRFVDVGSYMIVEDTDVNGHPVCADHGPGPMEAVQAFLARNPDFVIDGAREKFLMTQNPCGFLKRSS